MNNKKNTFFTPYNIAIIGLIITVIILIIFLVVGLNCKQNKYENYNKHNTCSPPSPCNADELYCTDANSNCNLKCVPLDTLDTDCVSLCTNVPTSCNPPCNKAQTCDTTNKCIGTLPCISPYCGTNCENTCDSTQTCSQNKCITNPTPPLSDCYALDGNPKQISNYDHYAWLKQPQNYNQPTYKSISAELSKTLNFGINAIAQQYLFCNEKSLNIPCNDKYQKDCTAFIPNPPNPPPNPNWVKCTNTDGSPIKYTLSNNWSGLQIYNDIIATKPQDWYVDKGPDMTHGITKYIDNTDSDFNMLIPNPSPKNNLIIKVGSFTNGQVKSIRLKSKGKFQSGLFVISINHLPSGDGVWPAWWLTGPDWPNNGEIDIFEGINPETGHMTLNQSTLHTKQGCNGGVQSNIGVANCNKGPSPSEPYQGCSQQFNDVRTFDTFNKDGGIYACELSTCGDITIWFFTGQTNIPDELKDNYTGSFDPHNWKATETKHFSKCFNYFKDLSMILNIAICGDWSNSQYGTNDDCKNAISKSWKNNENPKAYWDFNWIKVYT